MRLRIVSLVVLLATLAVTLSACGGSSSSGGGTTEAESTEPAAETVDNTYALKYTGGKEGKADSSLPPVTIGYINQEGGVPSFPEATQGMEAAVDYVNEELGGIEGHPLALKKC